MAKKEGKTLSVYFNAEREGKLSLLEGEKIPDRIYQIINRYYDMVSGYAIPEKILEIEKKEGRNCE